MAKKLLLLTFSLLVGVFFAGNVFALNAPAMQGGNPDNWYIEVEYNTNSRTGFSAGSAAHGMVLEWDVDSDTGETLGYTVHLADTADAENVAGIIPAWNDYAHNLSGLGRAVIDGDRFLMQIRGYHSGACTDDSVVEGQSIEPSGAANGLADGDGFGFAFKADASNDSTNKECGAGGTFAPVWIDFDKGTN